MISDNPKVSVEIFGSSLYTRPIALKDAYHKKRMDMLAYTPVEFNFLETYAKTYHSCQTKPLLSRKQF